MKPVGRDRPSAVDINSPGFNDVAAATTTFPSIALPAVAKPRPKASGDATATLLRALETTDSALTQEDVKEVTKKVLAVASPREGRAPPAVPPCAAPPAAAAPGKAAAPSSGTATGCVGHGVLAVDVGSLWNPKGWEVSRHPRHHMVSTLAAHPPPPPLWRAESRVAT